jgi:hypothetical protein
MQFWHWFAVQSPCKHTGNEAELILLLQLLQPIMQLLHTAHTTRKFLSYPNEAYRPIMLPSNYRYMLSHNCNLFFANHHTRDVIVFNILLCKILKYACSEKLRWVIVYWIIDTLPIYICVLNMLISGRLSLKSIAWLLPCV